MPTDQPRPKAFAMIREFHLADWFTLANALCGTGAIFSAITFVQTGDTLHLYFAGALILAALVFDVLDGRIARWRRQSSSLGRATPWDTRPTHPSPGDCPVPPLETGRGAKGAGAPSPSDAKPVTSQARPEAMGSFQRACLKYSRMGHPW
jgi:hypothetical protein